MLSHLLSSKEKSASDQYRYDNFLYGLQYVTKYIKKSKIGFNHICKNSK